MRAMVSSSAVQVCCFSWVLWLEHSGRSGHNMQTQDLLHILVFTLAVSVFRRG
jgi:hypothetical protein